ncbi:MAG: hypothetical protein SP1CHLAM54_07260 [Chlamydiia bacterium]|nr:hypothetical protein [Chlamydiia bacterium]MCH9615632.1 hypothetical protein [Chlamydiia bacterium]MCH9628965.1 hypothetical protein [Chlamydiia bacterium]
MKELEKLRSDIDHVNEALIELLGKRLDLTMEIAKAKEALDLPIYDPERERAQDERLGALAIKQKLDPRIVQHLFNLFVNYTRDEMVRHLRKREKTV